MKMVNVLQAGEAETKAWRACNYKEGKAFPVLFDDLTSHYPISPALDARQQKSQKQQQQLLHSAQERDPSAKRTGPIYA